MEEMESTTSAVCTSSNGGSEMVVGISAEPLAQGYRLIAPVDIRAANGVEANDACPGAYSEVEILPAPPPQESPRATSRQKRRLPAAVIGALVALLVAVSVALFFPLSLRRTGTPSRNAWVQITNFSDSATQPALSLVENRLYVVRHSEAIARARANDHANSTAGELLDEFLETFLFNC
jgi:hypothetical protein